MILTAMVLTAPYVADKAVDWTFTPVVQEEEIGYTHEQIRQHLQLSIQEGVLFKLDTAKPVTLYRPKTEEERLKAIAGVLAPEDMEAL